MMKLRSKIFRRSNSKKLDGSKQSGINENVPKGDCEIKWELRPGGMLVQKRSINGGYQSSSSSSSSSTSSSDGGEGMITIRVSTVSDQCAHFNVSIDPTSTFGELKIMVSLMVRGMEAKDQRVIYKGKEREDGDYLHMFGIRDNHKVLLLEDPAIKESKLKLHHALHSHPHIHTTTSSIIHAYSTITV